MEKRRERGRKGGIRLNPEAKPIEFFFSPKMHFFLYPPTVTVGMGGIHPLARLGVWVGEGGRGVRPGLKLKAVVNSGTN